MTPEPKRVCLATTYHDQQDRLYDQIVEVLPVLVKVFQIFAVQASTAAPARSLRVLRQAGAVIRQEEKAVPGVGEHLGGVRKAALSLALEQEPDFILFFDFDSLLHWAQHYPDELSGTVARIPDHDLTLIGRTERAFQSHPENQRQTERLVNLLFARLTGMEWDIMRSGRGLSRRAAQAIVDGCRHEGISVDVVWPLFLLQRGGFTFHEIRVEGTEFETGDRYGPEIAAAGGYQAWMRQLDADPRRWAHRFELARRHAEAMVPYAERLKG